jgi:hypothetical protein
MATPPSWRGATRTSGRAWGFARVLGGNLRPRPQLPDGIVWGGPGRCWRGSPFQGLDCHPDQIPRPPFDRIARIGRPAGAIFRGLRCPGSCLQPPRSRRGGGTAPVTLACRQARGEVRPRAFTPHRHSRAGGNPYSPTNRLLPHPSGSWIPACAGMTRDATNPSSQQKLGSQERQDHPTSLHRHPGLVPGSNQRLGRNLPVDAETGSA